MSYGLIFLLAMVLSLLLTGLQRRYALARSLLDIPNERSSHTVPTPSGGGVSVVLTTLAGVVVLWWLGWISWSVSAGLLVGGAMVAGIGYWDDHRHVPARWRFLVHLAAAALVLVFAGSLPPVTVLGLEVAPGWPGAVVAVLFVVWTLNLYNFMDGIDGIAGIEAVTVCGAATLLLGWAGEGELAVLVGLYGAASLGFLVWNWPPAKIFMGDAGSGFLGFSLAALALLTWVEAGFSIFSWLILLGVFIVDATVTLLRRVWRGERFYQAHRSHAYQYAARRCGAHRPVSLACGAINLFWLLPLAALVAVGRLDEVLGVVMAYAPLVGLAVRFKAGARELQEV